MMIVIMMITIKIGVGDMRQTSLSWSSLLVSRLAADMVGLSAVDVGATEITTAMFVNIRCSN